MVLYLMCHTEVLAILPKLEKYRYAFITDGQPDIFTAERRNIDKPTDKYTPRDYYNKASIWNCLRSTWNLRWSASTGSPARKSSARS